MAKNNFGGLPEGFADYKNSKIVILPVPFDKTSTWIKGSDKGPKAIIESSCNMELYDIETNSEIYKEGIFTEKEIKAQDSESMINEVNRTVETLLKDRKFAVVLGGEHSVSIGSIKAHSSFFKDFSILHLDAHSDMREIYEGNKYSHACAMARAKEITKNIISVGIRSMDSSEIKSIDKDKIFYAEKIVNCPNWVDEIIKRLSANVYITIDLDVFDPSIMPSTGTPEPGGLQWYPVLNLLRAVAEKKNVVGFDVVELCPNNINKSPDFLAAKLIYKLLSYKFSKK